MATRAVPGVEVTGDGWYARTLALPHGTGTVRLDVPHATTAGETAFATATFALDDLRDTSAAVERTRRMLDADCDPVAVAEAFAGDPVVGPLARRRPGLRVPGHVDGDELAVRAVLGQQVSVAGARTLAARLTAQHGRRAGPADRGTDAPVPRRRDARRARPRRPADAPCPGPCAGHALRRLGGRFDRPGPGHRPRRGASRPARAARHRPLDRRLHRAARTGPPRRVPADRRRHADRARAAWPRSRPGRASCPGPGAPGAPTPRCTCGASLDDPWRRTDMWTLMDSPVGELRIVAQAGAITAIEFAPFPEGDGRSRGERTDDDPVLRSAREQLDGVLRPRAQGVRPPPRPAGHTVPAAGLGRAARDRVRRDRVVRAGRAPPRDDQRGVPRGRSGQRPEPDRRSSSRATA